LARVAGDVRVLYGAKHCTIPECCFFTGRFIIERTKRWLIIQEAINYLAAYSLPAAKGNLQSPINLSINAYRDFVNLLQGWLRSEAKQKANEPTSMSTNSFVATEHFKKDFDEWSFDY
jgi:hypothetical protein